MGAPAWPAFDADEHIYLDDTAKAFRTHCRKIVQYTVEYPVEKPSNSYIRELAAVMNRFLTQYLEIVGENVEEVYGGAEDQQDEGDDESDGYDEEAQADEHNYNRDENDDDHSSSATPGVRYLERWINDVETDATDHSIHGKCESSKLHRTETNSETPPTELTALDFRIKIRWGVTCPYSGVSKPYIYDDIQNSIRFCQNPLIENVNIAAIEMRGHRDLDIHLWHADDRKALLSCFQSWLPLIRAPTGAMIMEDTYSIVVHSVPEHFLSGRTPYMVIDDILHENDHLIHGATIAHLGWLSEKPEKGKCGTVVISFTDFKPANAILNSGIQMAHRRLTAKRYRPNCNIIQCPNCLAFGHAKRACSQEARCTLCAGRHNIDDCSWTKPSLAHKRRSALCANCLGSHRGDYTDCPERERLRSEAEAARLRPSPFFLDTDRPKQTHIIKSPPLFFPIILSPYDGTDGNQPVKGESSDGHDELHLSTNNTNGTRSRNRRPRKRRKHTHG